MSMRAALRYGRAAVRFPSPRVAVGRGQGWGARLARRSTPHPAPTPRPPHPPHRFAGGGKRAGGAGIARRTALTDIHERVSAVIQAFARGELVIVTDDDDRENEGDLFVAASLCTPEKMA